MEIVNSESAGSCCDNGSKGSLLGWKRLVETYLIDNGKEIVRTMKFDILFLGKLYPKEKEFTIKSKMKTGMQDAANALQWNIIDGLDENSCGTIKIVTQLPVNSYPKGYKDKKIKRFVFQHSSKYKPNDVVVGHTNITIIKQFAIYPAIKREVLDWTNQISDHKKVIILYTASSYFLKIAKMIKHRFREIIVCCIIADLPEYSCARKLHGIHKAYNDYMAKKCSRLYSYVDKYILLTKQMAQKLDIRVPFMVMEGIASTQTYLEDQSIVSKFKGERYILYTGTLNYEFGIRTLLRAFSLIRDNDIKLVICGTGAAEKEIRESVDGRIIFLGKIDRKQVLSLQQYATVLVNPRQNNEEFTKYSFPSKTMEYLAAGVPIVAYKLDGIPEEYDKHIIYVPDNTPESLAKTIIKVLNIDERERNKIGEFNKHFVLTEKNYLVQGRRILTLLAEN